MHPINLVADAFRAGALTAALISFGIFFPVTRGSARIWRSVIRRSISAEELVPLAAFGWCVNALAIITFTLPRLIQNVWPSGDNTYPPFWIALWLAIGFFLLMCGFHLPVCAMLWYRNRGRIAILSALTILAACVASASWDFLVLLPHKNNAIVWLR